jgi:hypothetical protein
MKAYVIATGIIFALVTLAHIWRAWVEGPGLAKDPWFIGVTVLTVALSVWAWRLARRGSKP